MTRRPWAWRLVLWMTALAFASFHTYVDLARAEFPVSGDVRNIIQIVQKDADPSLFPRDFLFSGNAYRLYAPAYVDLVQLLDTVTGMRDLERSIQLLQFPICLVFVVSMAWLVRRLTGSMAVALVTAVISTVWVQTSYRLAYGIGTNITPRFAQLAVTPLAFGALLFYGKDRRYGPAAFLFAGLASNLHFGSGTGLVFAFAVAWIVTELVVERRVSVRHWLLCAGAALVGVVPSLLGFAAGHVTPSPSELAAVPPPAVFNELVHQRIGFYPMEDIAHTIRGFALTRPWLAALVPAYLAVVKVALYLYPIVAITGVALWWRGRIRLAYALLFAANLAFMTLVCLENTLMVGTLVLPALVVGIRDVLSRREPDTVRTVLVFFVPAFGALATTLSVALIDAATRFEIYLPSFYANFGATLKYAPFVLNVYAALALAEAWMALRRAPLPRAQRMREAGVVALVALAIVVRFLVTPFNGFAAYRADLGALVNGRALFAATSAQAAYREATAWAKRDTPPDALFLVLDGEDFTFRYKAQRSMWVSSKDGGIAFFNGRAAFARWGRESAARQALVDAASPAALGAYVAAHRIDYVFAERTRYGWAEAVPGGRPVFSNARYVVLSVGRHS